MEFSLHFQCKNFTEFSRRNILGQHHVEIDIRNFKFAFFVLHDGGAISSMKISTTNVNLIDSSFLRAQLSMFLSCHVFFIWSNDRDFVQVRTLPDTNAGEIS